MSQLVDQVRLARRLPSPRIARAIREEAGVSQVALAAELGVHRVTLVRWESGTRRPRGKTLAAYVALLDQLREVTAA
jgi:DNA-binding transcriptional regulator YiaG